MIIKQDRQHVVVNDTPAPEPRSLATKDTRIESTRTPFFPDVYSAPPRACINWTKNIAGAALISFGPLSQVKALIEWIVLITKSLSELLMLFIGAHVYILFVCTEGEGIFRGGKDRSLISPAQRMKNYFLGERDCNFAEHGPITRRRMLLRE